MLLPHRQRPKYRQAARTRQPRRRRYHEDGVNCGDASAIGWGSAAQNGVFTGRKVAKVRDSVLIHAGKGKVRDSRISICKALL